MGVTAAAATAVVGTAAEMADWEEAQVAAMRAVVAPAVEAAMEKVAVVRLEAWVAPMVVVMVGVALAMAGAVAEADVATEVSMVMAMVMAASLVTVRETEARMGTARETAVAVAGMLQRRRTPQLWSSIVAGRSASQSRIDRRRGRRMQTCTALGSLSH